MSQDKLNSKIIAARFPYGDARRIGELAKGAEQTTSEFIREAVRFRMLEVQLGTPQSDGQASVVAGARGS